MRWTGGASSASAFISRPNRCRRLSASSLSVAQTVLSSAPGKAPLKHSSDDNWR